MCRDGNMHILNFLESYYIDSEVIDNHLSMKYFVFVSVFKTMFNHTNYFVIGNNRLIFIVIPIDVRVKEITTSRDVSRENSQWEGI